MAGGDSAIDEGRMVAGRCIGREAGRPRAARDRDIFRGTRRGIEIAQQDRPGGQRQRVVRLPMDGIGLDTVPDTAFAGRIAQQPHQMLDLQQPLLARGVAEMDVEEAQRPAGRRDDGLKRAGHYVEAPAGVELRQDMRAPSGPASG